MNLVKDYFSLCKPKVVALMLLTAWVGMQLASPQPLAWANLVIAMLGIGLMSSSAAVFNHILDRRLDLKMVRTLFRPVASGRIPVIHALIFALALGWMGFSVLFFWVNPLTAHLTLVTSLGYALLYSRILKPLTPQNIVIGGLSGAMPPLLGWVAASGSISAHAWLPVLIIFTWTPPHFWALAIYRHQDYQNANLPMLPVTHGIPFTKLCIVLYTCLLLACSLLPFVTGMSGFFYLFSALFLGFSFLIQTLILYKSTQVRRAYHTFSFSILYLLLLFSALLIDHVLERF